MPLKHQRKKNGKLTLSYAIDVQAQAERNTKEHLRTQAHTAPNLRIRINRESRHEKQIAPLFQNNRFGCAIVSGANDQLNRHTTHFLNVSGVRKI